MPVVVCDLLCPACSEWTHLPFTMPLEVWTVRVQHTRPGSSIFRTLYEIYHVGGMSAFFKSASAFLVLATKPAIKYTIYERVRMATLARRNQRRLLLAVRSHPACPLHAPTPPSDPSMLRAQMMHA